MSLLICGIVNAIEDASNNPQLVNMKSSFIIHSSSIYVGGINKSALGIGLGFDKPFSEIMEIYGGVDYFFSTKTKGEITASSMNTYPSTTTQIPVNLTYNLYRANMNGNYHFLHNAGDDFTMYGIAGFSVLFAWSKNQIDNNYNTNYSFAYSDRNATIAMYANLGVGATFKTGKVFPFVNAQYNYSLGGSDAEPPSVKIPSLITVMGGLRIQL